MSEQMRESLSALMDNEANELEIERVLRRSGELEVRSTWRRYQLTRSALRGEFSGHTHTMDISEQVRESIERGEGNAASKQPVARWRHVLQPVASFAVAASVFSAVLIGSQLYGLLGTDSGLSSANSLAARVSPVGIVNTIGGAAVIANYGAPAIKSATVNPRAAYNKLAHQRLQRYLLPHTDEATLNTPQGMMPYARVASFQAGE